MDEMKQEQESMKLVPKVDDSPENQYISCQIPGDPQGDVGERLVEEAADHRDDDDAGPAALWDQLRHLLLNIHLREGRLRFSQSLKAEPNFLNL